MQTTAAGGGGVTSVYTTPNNFVFLQAGMTTRTVIFSNPCNGTDKAVSGAWWTDNGAADFSISNQGVSGSQFIFGVMNKGVATNVTVNAVCLKTN